MEVDLSKVRMTSKQFHVVAKILSLAPEGVQNELVAKSEGILSQTNPKFNSRIFSEAVKKYSYERN